MELYVADIQWIDINNFVHKTGLDLVVACNILDRTDGQWDYKNTHHLLKFSDEMGYNISWQLGYGMYIYHCGLQYTGPNGWTVGLQKHPPPSQVLR